MKKQINQQPTPVVNIPEKTLDEFFDNEYLNFAMYVVEHRAIPSVIDGFKPTARKVAFAANNVWKTGKEKSLKIFQLAGVVASTAFYHHGNASLESAIIGMTQTFKNSIPIFDGIGQFGSLRCPEAGAPRYIGVKFNENFRRLYKDFELCTPKFEEGEQIEPKFFLPIVPTILLNGGSGIAVGFATDILNRKASDVIEACIDVLNDRPIRELKPWNREFRGSYERFQSERSSWIVKGLYTVKGNYVQIDELTPGWTHEKYEAFLATLESKGVILGYENLSTDVVKYLVKFKQDKIIDLQFGGKLQSLLKLSEKYTENLTTLDEHGKLKIFKTPQEIVKYFVHFRLAYYSKRKTLLIEKLNREIKILKNRIRFIESIVDDTLKLRGVPKNIVEDNLNEMSFDKDEGSYDYLTRMSISTLVKEKIEELKALHLKKDAELQTVINTTEKDMYLRDLNALLSCV